MKCPDCSRKMVCLFTSYVCDWCNPTNAINVPKEQFLTHAWVLVYSRWGVDLGHVDLVFADKESGDRYLDDVTPGHRRKEFNVVRMAFKAGSKIRAEQLSIVDKKSGSLEQSKCARVVDITVDGTLVIERLP